MRCDTVQDGARADGDVHVWNVADLRGAVGLGEDSLAQVSANLLPVYFKRCDEFNVFHFVRPKCWMHETGGVPCFLWRVLPVILHSLNKSAGTISDTGYGDAYLSRCKLPRILSVSFLSMII